MNRFFRSALFPLIIIAALVWLALQTLGNRNAKVEKQTTSQVYTLVSSPTGAGQIDGPVKINPSKQELALTLSDGKKVVVHYATAESEAALEKAMLKSGVPFDSKGVGSSPWWSILMSMLPFVLLIGFWIFLMNKMQGGGSKVMSFGKSRAKRMTPDSPKIGFKDVAGVDEAVEELHEIKEFLENPKKFQALGARIPKGVLLYGPPGTGKTLLARAV
ncbi:MAG: AAA family ATPase, partial [Gaiellaceae bacterium]